MGARHAVPPDLRPHRRDGGQHCEGHGAAGRDLQVGARLAGGKGAAKRAGMRADSNRLPGSWSGCERAVAVLHSCPMFQPRCRMGCIVGTFDLGIPPRHAAL